jgi:hypothetical protein
MQINIFEIKHWCSLYICTCTQLRNGGEECVDEACRYGGVASYKFWNPVCVLKLLKAFKMCVCIKASLSLCFMILQCFYAVTLCRNICTFITDFNCVLYKAVLKSNASYYLLLTRNTRRRPNMKLL